MMNPIKKLSDSDIEVIRHMIRRDAYSDLQIAAEVEKRGKVALGNDSAKAMAIHRYRNSKEFANWKARFENAELEMRKQIEQQKQRFELVSNLVKDADGTGFDTVAKSLQGRLLTIAAEMSDEDLLLATSGKGPVKNLLALVQQQMRLDRDQKVEELKQELTRLLKPVGSEKISAEKVIEKVDEIMGLKKQK